MAGQPLYIGQMICFCAERFHWRRIWQNPGELLLPGLSDMATRALLYRRPAEPATLLVRHGSPFFAIRLRRHRRARRYTLRIHPTDREAILTMPLRGTPHRIVHRAGERGTVWAETRDSGERILCVAGDAEYTDRRVHDFLKREARKDLQKAAQFYAGELGVRVRRVSIRDQSSRWGSCTSAGSLSFSWRLILAPPYVLDYLAAHEVAHLVEMNHSARFWRVVAKACDHVDRAKSWLDTHGNDLHRYGIQD